MSQDKYDVRSVRSLFDEMAATYGYVNLLSSFGFTARWRRQAADDLPLREAECVIDLMSGMGELWRSLSKTLPSSARVIGVDLSPEMARRTPRTWHFPVEICVTDVLTWEAPLGSADVVVSSFGLKTFDREQQQRLAHKVADILKVGGYFSFIEISVPCFPLLRTIYMFYLKGLIPIIGKLLLGNPDCYRRLGEYTDAFENVSYFASCLRAAGLEVNETSYFFGCATGVRGIRPALIRATSQSEPIFGPKRL